jgi:nicotinamide-nucleotide amidase
MQTMGKLAASIITIGDELLIGQTIDTNSAWMAQELNKIGVWVKRRVAVGDTKEDIWNALEEESKHAGIILITGGLGPTADDITKPLLCEYFGGKMIVNETVRENVINIFTNILKRPLLDRNLKQAEVPDVCTVIPNTRGTAPGMLFSKEGNIFVSMPGVPHEMKGMMTAGVIPYLLEHYSMPAILHRTLLCFGVGESFLAEKLVDFEVALPAHIKLAYLPNYGMVRMRLTSTGSDKAVLETEMVEHFNQLKLLLSDSMISDTDEGLEAIVARLLLEHGKTMSTAESCTGGYIANLITARPGASAWYRGSVVSYDNSVKEGLLQVSKETLDTAGAVSEETVRQMVAGAFKAISSDYTIAVSGIMGPDGGSEAKPVGMVWIAAGNKDTTITECFKFRFDRKKNIELTAMQALNMLRKLIIQTVQQQG